MAVITNIELDHISQNGIESLEDIAHIKALVAERVREGGALVLNADDRHAAALAENRFVKRAPRRIVYFSLHADHVLVRRHRDARGAANFPRDVWLAEAIDQAEQSVARIDAIPATLAGTCTFQITNALAALAACHAAGLDADTVAAALTSFGADAEAHHPGRMNLYSVPTPEGGVAIAILDDGHNPHAFEAVGWVIDGWDGGRFTGVVNVPGDRADRLIEAVGRVAAEVFDLVIVREDVDTRGRAPDEVAALLCRASRQAALGKDCRVVRNERVAVATALRELWPGEVVVAFDDDLEGVRAVLAQVGAQPVAATDALARLAAARRAPLKERFA